MDKDLQQLHIETEQFGVPYLQSRLQLSSGSYLEITTTHWAKDALESHVKWISGDQVLVKHYSVFRADGVSHGSPLETARVLHKKILELLSAREGPW